MASICSQQTVRGCPASHYLICGAYATGRNCWETQRKPCCRETDLNKCVSCGVFLRGQKEMAQDLDKPSVH